ncbi:ORF68L [Turbot reddish body iridovirus]|uniref:ORF68L n=1 Tax=Turbot reddish body iridovirus TaxID=273651 RepID=E2CU13_ISKNV|nr:ORF68L [Turbot reddish body iridovirus]
MCCRTFSNTTRAYQTAHRRPHMHRSVLHLRQGGCNVRVCCVYARPAAGRRIEFVFVCRLKSRQRRNIR